MMQTMIYILEKMWRIVCMLSWLWLDNCEWIHVS